MIDVMNREGKQHHQSWRQVSLRTLLISLTIVTIVLGSWIVSEKSKAKRENAAIEELRVLGAQIYSKPKKLASILLGESIQSVVGIGLRGNGRLDAQNLAPLADLHNLVWIDLQWTKLGDGGLAHLSKLRHLKRLRIDETQVTDDGMKHLGTLVQLENLNLSRTRVGDEGLLHLKNLTRLEGIELSRTQITDSGLAYLEGMSQLEYLNLQGTNVSPGGTIQLKKKLAKLR